MLPAATRFPKVSVILQLACYACQLGPSARGDEMAEDCDQVDGAKNVKERAAIDPDLASLREQIENM